MLRGKPWTIEEERQLRTLAEQGLSAQEIGLRMNKKPNSVYEKARRIGLVVGISQQRKKALSALAGDCTSDPESTSLSGEKCAGLISGCGFSLSPDGGLPSVEEALKFLVAAANQLSAPGLRYDETMRLRTIISAMKTYKELLADFLNYRELEKRMVELEAKYSELVAKTKNVQS